MGQLAEYNGSHHCYSPLITRGSAGRVQLVTLLLLSTHHSWISLQSTAGHKLLLLSTHHPWISWQSTAGHISLTLHSSPVSVGRAHWSHFGYSPLNTHVSPGGAHRPHFCYSPLIIRRSTGREILISLKHKLLIVIN